MSLLTGVFILVSFFLGGSLTGLGFYLGQKRIINNADSNDAENRTFLKKKKPVTEDFPDYTGDERNKKPQEPEVLP